MPCLKTTNIMLHRCNMDTKIFKLNTMLRYVVISTLLSINLFDVANAINGWHVNCRGLNTMSMKIDPIVNYGRPAAHHHNFASSTLINAYTNTEDLLSSPCSVCSIVEDKSAYWIPSLFRKSANGQPEFVPIEDFNIYYFLHPNAGEPTVPVPRGLKLVAGDPGATGPKPQNQLNLNFNGNDARGTFPEQYSNAQSVTAFIMTPNCVRKDFDPNAKEHTKFTKYAGENEACGSEYYRIPSINIHPRWNLGGASWTKEQGCPFSFATARGFMSGNGYSYHSDFMNGWDEAKMKSLIDQCMNVDVHTCLTMVANNSPESQDQCRNQLAQIAVQKIDKDGWRQQFAAFTASSFSSELLTADPTGAISAPGKSSAADGSAVKLFSISTTSAEQGGSPSDDIISRRLLAANLPAGGATSRQQKDSGNAATLPPETPASVKPGIDPRLLPQIQPQCEEFRRLNVIVMPEYC